MKLSSLRRKLCALCIGFACLISSGCWDRVEINDLALITGAALDRGDNGMIELTIQIFVPNPKSGESLEGGKNTSGETVVRSAQGITIADAMNGLQQKLPRKVFWGHNEVIIFGEQLAHDGVRDHMDFLLRDAKPRERAYMFVSQGKARDILKLHPPIERNSSEVLREMAKMKTNLSVTMKDLAESFASQNGTAILPIIEILPPIDRSAPNNTLGYLKGSAVFKNYKMAGRFDDVNTRLLQAIRNSIPPSNFSISPENSKGFISFVQLRTKTTLHPLIKGNSWRMHIVMHGDYDVNQNTTNMDLLDPQTPIRKVEADLEKIIEGYYKKMTKDAQQRVKVDVLRYGKAFHRKYPQQWKTAKFHWDELFPQVETTVEVHVRIRRSGISNMNAATKE